MTDLSGFDDDSFDLVYSGQSIEHVSEKEGDSVFEQVQRVLRPGGWFALDTPNGRVTRLQQDEFIDPDHEIEYTLDQLIDKADRAGLIVREVRGLNYAGDSLTAGRFDEAEVAGNTGIYAEAADCYILALVLQKP
jgi:predicted SAM-dependent methyltransferase